MFGLDDMRTFFLDHTPRPAAPVSQRATEKATQHGRPDQARRKPKNPVSKNDCKGLLSHSVELSARVPAPDWSHEILGKPHVLRRCIVLRLSRSCRRWMARLGAPAAGVGGRARVQAATPQNAAPPGLAVAWL